VGCVTKFLNSGGKSTKSANDVGQMVLHGVLKPTAHVKVIAHVKVAVAPTPNVDVREIVPAKVAGDPQAIVRVKVTNHARVETVPVARSVRERATNHAKAIGLVKAQIDRRNDRSKKATRRVMAKVSQSLPSIEMGRETYVSRPFLMR
jgi:hypothetical protein